MCIAEVPIPERMPDAVAALDLNHRNELPGVPERVAMEITGHKTRAVFERYNIVSHHDKDTAMQRLAMYLKSQPMVATVLPLIGSESAGR